MDRLREGILSSLGKTEAGKKTSVHVGLTVALMVLMNGAALFLKDLGLVVGLGGRRHARRGSNNPPPQAATALPLALIACVRALAFAWMTGAILGSALVYIFPALMATGEKAGAIPTKAEKAVNWALAGLGVFFAGLGSYMCLQ